MIESYSIARACNARKRVTCLAMMGLIAAIIFGIVTVLHRQATPIPWLVAIALMLVVGVFYFLDRSKYVRFKVEQGHLLISGDIFGRRFPLETLRLDRAEILDLTQASAYRPRWKIIGTNMPGYSAGEFSLRNGKSAHVFLSDLRRVLCIPMMDGYVVLLSCDEAENLLATLVEKKTPMLSP